ncbi:MAG: stress response protein [Thermoleophilia bacterium]|nr:stress response protein [Thermoleophilia bacterium]
MLLLGRLEAAARSIVWGMKVESIAEQLYFVTVHITSVGKQAVATGTGFIHYFHMEDGSRNGVIVTNKHVVEPATTELHIKFLKGDGAGAPALGRIDVSFNGSRETASLLAGQAVEKPDLLLSPSNPKRDPKPFTLTLGAKMGQKRGKGPGSFVGDTKQHTLSFYRELVQTLRGGHRKRRASATLRSSGRCRLRTRMVAASASSPQEPSQAVPSHRLLDTRSCHRRRTWMTPDRSMIRPL